MTFKPFHTKVENNRITLQKSKEIRFIRNQFTRAFVLSRAGARIAQKAFRFEQPLSVKLETIIELIHKKRFNPTLAYVVSSDHFPDIYMRNMGIFFNAFLDSRVTLSQEDWNNRQRVVLQTIAIDLEILKQAGQAYTTIVPIYGKYYTGMNIYTDPSDSLFGVLYGLNALIDASFVPTIYPSTGGKKRKLLTTHAATTLLRHYKNTLIPIIEKYREQITHEETGLIKNTITLASARDGIRRVSSFYDNVIFWATFRLANKLGILAISEKRLEEWKKLIIQTYWDEEEGIFLDDQSERAKKEKIFCSDSLIVLSTQFLTPENPQDQAKLTRIIDYIQKNKLDTPLPLRYSLKDNLPQLYHPVRFFAPSYMGETIWSHWGMEYIKMLILMSKYKTSYIQKAENHLKVYEKKMQRYGGYPELYDKNGNLYQTRFYRSLLHNSWIIGYEQAKFLLRTFMLQ